MKGWIDANGPISACFSCYPEFDDACKNNSVYIYKNPNNDPSDAPAICDVLSYVPKANSALWPSSPIWSM